MPHIGRAGAVVRWVGEAGTRRAIGSPVEGNEMTYVRRVISVSWQLAGLLLLAAHGGAAWAGAPQCYPNGGSSYCMYSGPVSYAYINSNGWILLYFDTPVDPNALASAGITGVTTYGAAMYVMSNYPDFGKALYATLLAAQARGVPVNVMMTSVSSGYLQMDRVYVSP